MKLSIVSIIFAAAVAQSSAFTVSVTGPSKARSSKTQIKVSSLPLPYLNEDISQVQINETIASKPIQAEKTSKQKSSGAHEKKESFLQSIMTAKKAIGDDNLNKIRGKAIGKTYTGISVMQQLFALMDKKTDGGLDEYELAFCDQVSRML